MINDNSIVAYFLAHPVYRACKNCSLVIPLILVRKLTKLHCRDTIIQYVKKNTKTNKMKMHRI